MTTNAKKILKIAGLSIFFALIIAYAFFVSRNLIFGIRIKDVQINGVPATETKVFEEGTIKIAGKAKNAIKLALNGREISINLEGDFEETIALLPGYNIVSLRAEDKFGYTDEKDYKLIYKRQE